MAGTAAAAAISVAPLFQYSTPQWLLLLSRISRTAVLYTEMLVADHVIRRPEVIASFHDVDPACVHRMVPQLGGSDARVLGEAARLCASHGFNKINFNVGCPSDRVRSGSFGCVLMKSPQTVVDAVRSMSDALGGGVSIKCRIGVDNDDSYAYFRDFVGDVALKSGATEFVVHARKAWLHGVSPKYNRTVPPLRPEYVTRIKAELPHLNFVLNGGLRSANDIRPYIGQVDGVMVGRAVMDSVWALRDIEIGLGIDTFDTSRDAVLEEYSRMIDRAWPNPHPYFSEWALATAAQSLYAGEAFGRLFRRAIGELRQRDKTASAAVLLSGAKEVMERAREEARLEKEASDQIRLEQSQEQF